MTPNSYLLERDEQSDELKLSKAFPSFHYKVGGQDDSFKLFKGRLFDFPSENPFEVFEFDLPECTWHGLDLR